MTHFQRIFSAADFWLLPKYCADLGCHSEWNFNERNSYSSSTNCAVSCQVAWTQRAVHLTRVEVVIQLRGWKEREYKDISLHDYCNKINWMAGKLWKTWQQKERTESTKKMKKLDNVWSFFRSVILYTQRVPADRERLTWKCILNCFVYIVSCILNGCRKIPVHMLCMLDCNNNSG